jgi:hypothetical protein
LDDDALLAHMGVPLKYIPFVHDTELPDEAGAWLENLPYIFRPSFENLRKGMCGTGLILSGPGSTRKTTTAAAILLAAVRAEIPNTDPTGRNFTWHGAAMGRFVDWQEASELFRSANHDDEAAEAAAAIREPMHPSGPMTERGDFLVIDDISRERPTEYNAGELQRIIRRRSDNGYPTILTTNHSPHDWAKNHGDVLAGFLSRSFVTIEFFGDTNG